MAAEDSDAHDLIASVLALLNDVDPMRLEPGRPGSGIPEDEYTYEATSIAEHLVEHGGITLGAVDGIWQHWFSMPLTENVADADARTLVENLNALA